jgi:hypothetical protein
MRKGLNLAALYVFWATTLLIPEAVMAAQCPAEQLAAGANLGNGLFVCHRNFMRLPRRDPAGEQHDACLAASQSQFIAQYDQATASLPDCVLKVRGQAVNRMWTSLFDTIANPLLEAWRQDVNVPLQNGRFSPASRNRRFSTIDKVLGLGLRRALRVESEFARANELAEASKNEQRSKLARTLQRKIRNLTVKRPDYNGPNPAQLTVLAKATVSEIVRLALTPSGLSLTVPEATGGLNGAEVDDGTRVLVSLPTPFVKETDQVAVTWGNQAPVSLAVAADAIAAGLATVDIPASVILAAGGGEIDVTATLTELGGGVLAVSSPAVKVTVNTAPRFTSTPPANATQGAPYRHEVAAADSDPGATLTLTAPTLPAWLTLTPTGNGTATLSGTPGSADVGTHSVLLRVTDGTNSVEQGFTIAVDNVNDVPDFRIGPDQTVREDAGPQTVTSWATGIVAGLPNEASQTLTFLVIGNTNPRLFAAGPAVTPDGRLTYTPAPNANGSATITLALQDNGGTANGGRDTTDPRSFVITVNPVNDAPSFARGADQAVNEDAGPQTVAWATALSAGPADEAGQALTFLVTGNTNPGLFSAGPIVSSAGVLSYTPAPNVSGSATITLALQDNGGTANGGQDTSAPQSFTITVNPGNDPPVITSIPLTRASEGTLYTYEVEASDPDAGDTLTIRAQTPLPRWLMLRPTGNGTATLSGTPGNCDNGNQPIVLQVSDGTSNLLQSFTISVSGSCIR